MKRIFLSLLLGIIFSSIAIANESLRYDQISYLTTHNSFNYAKRTNAKRYGPLTYLFPNQNYPINVQLKHGVRAFMLDLYRPKKEVILCHGGNACGILGKDRAIRVFYDVRKFLIENPKEIITFILESYISTNDLNQVLLKSGLSPFLFAKEQNTPWPLIQDMIATNRRLVILNDQTKENDPAWNHDLWSSAVETPYSYKKIKDLNCAFNRGNPKNSLFIFNHFTTFIAGKRLDAKKINKRDFLSKRIIDCRNKLGKLPNFVTVDFYQWGDALEVVKELNEGRL